MWQCDKRKELRALLHLQFLFGFSPPQLPVDVRGAGFGHTELGGKEGAALSPAHLSLPTRNQQLGDAGWNGNNPTHGTGAEQQLGLTVCNYH